jgi:signal transduction histidine kinase
MLHEQHRFISDASHELRTPLTSLKSAFEVYLRNRKRTKAEADQLVTESIGEVDKLKMLSDSLLSLAHYELPERPLFTTISSKDIVEFAYKRIKNMAEQQHIRFEFPDTAISFQGNFDSVTDLFVILFDNAIKYSPEGSTVSISQEIKDGSVLFSVTDRGIGIAKSDLPHIFDRFYRADAARSRSNMGGYGLGLSIAKKIADMHNGSLRVESIIGKGTTFFVRFPKKHR